MLIHVPARRNSRLDRPLISTNQTVCFQLAPLAVGSISLGWECTFCEILYINNYIMTVCRSIRRGHFAKCCEHEVKVIIYDVKCCNMQN